MITLQDKINLLYILVKNYPSSIASTVDIEKINGYSRCFHITHNIKFNEAKITKSDMKYINTVWSNLIKLLGTDISYIKYNYEVTKYSYSYNETWVSAYKTLLDYYNKTI